VVTALLSGLQGLRKLRRPYVRARILTYWVVFILLFPVVLSVVAVGTVLGGISLPQYNFLVPLSPGYPVFLILDHLYRPGRRTQMEWFRAAVLAENQKCRTVQLD